MLSILDIFFQLIPYITDKIRYKGTTNNNNTHMTIPVGTIIGAGTKIAEYFGLIEGVDSKITKLLHQAFNSAVANLEVACNSFGQNQIDYIKQARIEFNQSVQVEDNENKILALVGLSMCQFLLGDVSNSKKTYNKINSVELSKAEIVKYTAADVSCFSLPLNLLLPFDSLAERELHFYKTKASSLIINKKLLQ